MFLFCFLFCHTGLYQAPFSFLSFFFFFAEGKSLRFCCFLSCLTTAPPPPFKVSVLILRKSARYTCRHTRAAHTDTRVNTRVKFWSPPPHACLKVRPSKLLFKCEKKQSSALCRSEEISFLVSIWRRYSCLHSRQTCCGVTNIKCKKAQPTQSDG